MIDISQCGNVASVSTNHYIISMMYYLHGAAESHNTGTIVLTDFSKAFDLVDHTIHIERIIQMGLRRNYQQCVRFNNMLSDYLQLTAGVPQGTKLGPIGFQILINNAAVSNIGHLLEDLHTFSDWAATNGLNLNAKHLWLISAKPYHKPTG